MSIKRRFQVARQDQGAEPGHIKTTGPAPWFFFIRYNVDIVDKFT
jgi:hypothetical protein